MNFRVHMIEKMKHMLSTSPPLVLHLPEFFAKDMIDSICGSSTEPPLHWRRPVIMNSYHGVVCVKGMAGNEAHMDSDDSDDSDDSCT